MLKNSRNTSIDLRRRQSFINLEGINIASCITIAMVIMILALSALLFASYPNSNFPANI